MFNPYGFFERLRGRPGARWAAPAGDGRLADARDDNLDVLLLTLELRDHWLGLDRHCTRVARAVRRLGEELGVDDDDLAEAEYAARVHEVGLITVPAALLRKPTPLTTQELRTVRGHARVGAQLVRDLARPVAAEVIEHQYADYAELRRAPGGDGPGLLLAGIFRVADVVETLTAPRPYQAPMPVDRRAELLARGSGSAFHPEVVRALLRPPGGAAASPA